jgi:uncharacterized protein GlcG (DUF336 family)
MLEAGEAKAASIGVAYNIAVVDAGGALVAFTRQDGALIGSIDLAIGKAITGAAFRSAHLGPRKNGSARRAALRHRAKQ